MALQTKTLTANGAKGHHKFTLTVSENSTSTTNNTSALSFSFVLSPVQTSWNWEQWGSSISYTVTINGNNYTGTIPAYDGYSSVTLKSGSLSVGHNSDGSKSISISFSVVDGAGQYYTCGNASSSGSMTLTTIPRASQPSIKTYPNTTQNIGDIGSTVYVHTNRNSTSFTHTLRYAFGSLVGTIATGVASNYQWTIPTSFYAQIPNATSGTGTVYCDTYNGNTLIGTKSVSFTTTVPSSVIPTVGTITLTPQTYNYLIQNKNKLNINVSGCSAGTGSAIKSYTFSGPGVSTTTTGTSVTSGTVSNTGTLTYTVKVTDNRGRTASKTATITCYAYSTPSITLNAYRVASNTSTTENDSGTYVRCAYNISYASVNDTNDVTVKIYYKKNSTSSWSSTTALTDSKNTSGNVTLSGIAIDSTYTVYAAIMDNYSGSSESNKVTIFSAKRICNIRPKGAGMAFGKIADTDDVLDSKWPIRSDDPATTMQNLTYRGTNAISSTENDTTSNWGSQGNLATTFYTATGKITDQPSQYGFLFNLTNGPGGSEVHQLWATQSSGNLAHRGGNSSGWNGSWRTLLDSTNYTSLVAPKPVEFYTNTGNTGGGVITKTLSSGDSLSNYAYLEIFYVDNHNNGHNSVKIYQPNGAQVDLSIVEVSDSTATNCYIRRTTYTITGSGTTVTITPNVTTAGYIRINGTEVSQTTGSNHIRIRRILGYK